MFTEFEGIMRRKFVECDTRFQAQKECPWANHIAKVADGFECFESKTEYAVWIAQK